ncbi:MAG: hypothetical protein J2P17_34485, partial [Mycobacterium sp.]|nr:hypothetical protein [Mycobacterium sp.]
LWAHPTKTGERIWVWVRAGASGDDIESALSYIAPACFARDARLHSVRKLATLVAVEIIRRDPLSTGQAIPSPLSRLVSLVKGDVTGEGTGTITPVTVADITATEVSPVPEGSTVRKNGHKTTTKPVESVEKTDSFVVAGEDLTDYIN